jgi:hypothetical protein
MSLRSIVRDFGLHVSPRVQHSPLWMLSPRAFRLWVFLAMESRHTAMTVPIFDGHRQSQRVSVNSGQWLTSSRALLKDAGYRSLKAVVADLKRLRDVGAISTEEITPCFQNGDTGVSKTETGGCFQNGNRGNVLATLVTVHGQPLNLTPVSKMETKEVQASPVSRKEQIEWELADQQLKAEGR